MAKDMSSGPIVNKYIKKLDDVLDDKSDSYFYIFRGQPSESYELDCTASRKFSNTKKEDKTVLVDNQVKLISQLRVKGFGFSKAKQKRFHDLEFLADLRHYGTPSCLIDFTSNFLIALWFACQKDKNQKDKNQKDGKIFILNCYDVKNFSLVSSKKLEETIDYLLGDKFKRLWYWIPERLNQRLTDQEAVFVFGKPVIPDTYFKYILVGKEDKEAILDELEKFFDYTKKALFSDKYALGEIYSDNN